MVAGWVGRVIWDLRADSLGECLGCADLAPRTSRMDTSGLVDSREGSGGEGGLAFSCDKWCNFWVMPGV